MSRRITENELKIPALNIINNNPGIPTSKLISKLFDIFSPTGEDAEILQGRNDTKFSQKVRNLKSHKTLDKYTTYSKEEGWKINVVGIQYLADNQVSINYLDDVLSTNYSYEDKLSFSSLAEETIEYNANAGQSEKEVFLYDENLFIDEGKMKTVTSVVRERSSTLRNAAIKHFTVDGRIKCSQCGFDFEETYGEIGKGYIEIHHVKPIFQYEDEETEKTIKKALENLIPVCANCHRMLHRKK